MTGDTPHLAAEPTLVDPDAGTGHNPAAAGDTPHSSGDPALVDPDRGTAKNPPGDVPA